MRISLTFFLISSSFFHCYLGQNCYDFDSKSSTCHLCSYDFYESSEMNWIYHEFDPISCTPGLSVYSESKTFVDSSRDCQSQICNGTQEYPYNNLFQAFENIVTTNKIYLNPIVNVYLFGLKPHFLYTNKTVNNPLYVFRRMNLTITIQPLFCKILNISGCFDDDFALVEVLIKNNDILFFISQKMILKNLRFDGVDMFAYHELKDETIKEHNLNVRICSENDLLIQNIDKTKSFCYIQNNLTVFSDKTIYGLFNLEMLYDCQTCSGPKLEIDNCQFINFLAFNGSTDIFNSLITILSPSNIEVSLQNTSVSQFFLHKGVLNFNQILDYYYVFVNPLDSIDSLEKKWNISIYDCSFSKFNFFGQIFMVTNDLPLSLFHLETNETKYNLLNLALNLIGGLFFDFGEQNYEFYFFAINGFNSNSQINYTDIIIFNNSRCYLTYFYGVFKQIGFYHMKILNNSEISMYFYSNIVQFYQVTVDFLIIGNASFFQVFETSLNLTQCNFTHIYSPNYDPLILNDVDYELIQQDKLQQYPYSKTQIFLIKTNFYLMNTTLINTDQMIYQMILQNCNFDSINLNFEHFFTLDVDYVFNASHCNFSNIFSGYLFFFTYCRNKYFYKIGFYNSTSVLFSAKVISIEYNIWVVFDQLFVRNLTLSMTNFININDAFGSYAYSCTTVKNSVFDLVDLTTITFTKIFCLIFQYIINFENVVLKNINTRDYTFYADSGTFVNFTNSVFDLGAINANWMSAIYINNCSFLASVSNYGCPMIVVNSLFHDNSILSNLNVDDGSLNYFGVYDFRYNLVFNCTFINNNADIFMESYMNFDFESNSPENYSKTQQQICNYLYWVYTFDWFEMFWIFTTNLEDWCGDGETLIYFEKDLLFNLTILNEYLINWSFGYVNCSFSNTLNTVFGFEQLTSMPLLFLKNSVVMNLQKNTYVINNRDCSLYITNSSFVNISSLNAQLGYIFRSHVVMINLIFENISLKDQVEGLFYFENSKVMIQNILCRNISMSKRGFIYGKSSIINITNLTISEGFSTGGCSALYIFKGKINITNCLFYKINSNNIGAICLQNVNQTNLNNISLQQGNTGLWISQGNSSQIYYISNFSCLNQTGFAGVCVYIQEAFILINESRFLHNKPTSSIVFSTVTNSGCVIKLLNIEFSFNDPLISAISIEKSNLTLLNVNFNNNTFQKFIYSSKSFLFIEALIFFANRNVYSDRETFSLINSTLNAVNISFEMNLYSVCLEASTNSYLILNNITFRRCSVAIKISKNAFLNVSKTVFSENLAFQESGAAINCQDSTIYSISNIFQLNSIVNDQTNLRGSDIYADNSLEIFINLTIIDTNFTFVNGSSIYVRGSFNLEINNVIYSEILVKPSQALYILNPISVCIQDLLLSNFSGYSAIEILSNYYHQMNIFINSSIFLNCSSDFSGGALNIKGDQIQLIILNSFFRSNKANFHGGAIFYMCFSCSFEVYMGNMSLKNNSFSQNQANLNGGALKLFSFNFSELLINQNKFEKNFALVGNNLAGDPKKLKITDNLTVRTQEEAKNMRIIDQIDGVSGNYSAFLVLLFDELDSFLITENVQKIKITPLDDTSLKVLENIQPIQNGISNFSIYTYATRSPNGTHSLIISHSIENRVSTSLQLTLRDCKKGENLINSQCVECGFGYFSLNIDDACTLCPPNVAFCPGRDLLIPVEGFWRFHENSSMILKCANIASCPDQTIFYLTRSSSSVTTQYNFSKPYEYVCGEGTYGNLCYRCKQNYGPSSTKACIKCGVQISVVALIIFNLLILLYQTTTAFESKDDISRSMMKILINHNNYLTLLEVFKSKIYNQNLDSVFAFNQQVSVIGTITDTTILDCIIQKMFDAEDIAMMRIAIFSFVPLIIILALVFTRFFALLIPRLKNKLKEKNKFSIFFSCLILVIYSYYPKLVSNAFSLLKCVSLDNSGRQFLEVDPNIECWGSTHNYYIIRIFVPNLLIWCLGWPIAFGLSLFIKRILSERSFKKMKEKNMFKSSKSLKMNEDILESDSPKSIKNIKKTKSIGGNFPKFLLSDQQKDEIFQKNKIYRFLTMEYHFTAYAWDEFFFGTNLLLLAIALGSENMEEVIFSVILMIVFFVMIIMTMKFKPFRFQENNKICTVSYLALLCTFYSVTNLIILESDDVIKQQFYFSLIFLVNVLFYSFWIYYFSMNKWIWIKTLVISLLKKKQKDMKSKKKPQKEKPALTEKESIIN